MTNPVVPAPVFDREPSGGHLADPARDIRIGTLVAVLFFGLFLGWASLARLDAAVYATGKLVVAGQRQAVQHEDGGIVAALDVKEGQHVARGQLLIRLDASEVKAGEDALASQAVLLLAQRARLEAEADGRATLETPEFFAGLPRQEAAKGVTALARQQHERDARAAALQAKKDTFSQRLAQAETEATGAGRQAEASKQQIELLDEQTSALRPAADRGYVSKTRMRELQRARAGLLGQEGRFNADVAKAHQSAAEAKVGVLEAQRDFQQQTAADLRDVEGKLGDVLPKLRAAREKLRRTEIRAPATGMVVGLKVFTEGGVVKAGEDLMDIIPDDAPLLIEARVSPDDADDLTTGVDTLVRFASLHERSLPDLSGKLTRLSADSFDDERTGSSYFKALVVVPREQTELIRAIRGSDFRLRAGMPVQVLVPLRKRTALEYVLEPLVGAFWGSFREH